MLCPVDGTSVLVMTERQGIEIDYCPTCRGVWLDRGELDKLIERSTYTADPQRRAAQVNRDSEPDSDRYAGNSDPHQKKRKNQVANRTVQLQQPYQKPERIEKATQRKNASTQSSTNDTRYSNNA